MRPEWLDAVEVRLPAGGVAEEFVPRDAPDERRHWHQRCWEIELNRTRGRRRGP